MGVADDLVVMWDVIEQGADGTTIRHAAGVFQYVRRVISALRHEFGHYIIDNNDHTFRPLFYLRPYGLTIPTIDLTRHEC